MPSQQVSKKVADNVEPGLWVDYGGWADKYRACATAHIDPDTGSLYYCVALYQGEMPVFREDRYPSLATLIARMRQIQPDLRKWRGLASE